MIKEAFHPSGMRIRFSSENHLYVDDLGRTYTSGTTFIGQFFPMFEKVAAAEKCASGVNPRYAGKTVESILDEWEAEGERGRDEGTNVHEYAECRLTGDKPPAPISTRCKNIFKQVDRALSDLSPYYQWVGSEVIVFDPETLMAGQIDLLMHHKGMNELIIFDWKQNKEITTENMFQKGIAPIDHLEDTDINHYSLQLSFYERLIRAGKYFPGVTRFNRALIHLTEDDFKIIRLEDYSYEIGEMMKTRLK